MLVTMVMWQSVEKYTSIMISVRNVNIIYGAIPVNGSPKRTVLSVLPLDPSVSLELLGVLFVVIIPWNPTLANTTTA